MTNEMEATKLGEVKDLFSEENRPIIGSEGLNLSLRGTSMGEESEFEKSLKAATPEPSTPHSTLVEPFTEPLNTLKNQLAPIVTEEVPVEVAYPKSPRVLKMEEEDEVYGMSLKNYTEGDVIKGTVLSIEKAGVFVDIGFKCEGFVANEELGVPKNEISKGEVITLVILQLETKEGYTLLSKRRADWEGAWKEAYQSYKLKEPVDIKVESSVKGGLVVSFKGLRGFIPSSLVSRNKADDLNSLIGESMSANVIEVDKKRKKIIFSTKSHERPVDNSKSEALEALEVGQVVNGRVTSTKEFGAFVNINGIEGLIHISEISWDRIEKVEDILHVGDMIDVFVLGVDKEAKRVSLGLKQLTPDPWEKVEETYPIGRVITGTISRTTTFGAFVKLSEGLEGLIHISELSHQHVKHVDDVVKVGQEVTVKVLRVIPEEQKIGLSLKALEEVVEEDTETVEE